uniref:helix-turn-helix domain-containing protein n=1 Tax=Jiella pelagia TaxID=2986949 RepID=UPI0038B39B37
MAAGTAMPHIASLADAERETLLQALEAENGNISKVARRLGISRPTLYRKLDLYGLSRKFV